MYRKYYFWFRKEQNRLHGFVEAEEEDDSQPFTVERGDSPFTGKTWGTERAETPR